MNISIKNVFLTLSLCLTSASLYCSDSNPKTYSPAVKLQMIEIGRENLKKYYPHLLPMSNEDMWARITSKFCLGQLNRIALWAEVRVFVQEDLNQKKAQEHKPANVSPEKKENYNL